MRCNGVTLFPFIFKFMSECSIINFVPAVLKHMPTIQSYQTENVVHINRYRATNKKVLIRTAAYTRKIQIHFIHKSAVFKETMNLLVVYLFIGPHCIMITMYTYTIM